MYLRYRSTEGKDTLVKQAFFKNKYFQLPVLSQQQAQCFQALVMVFQFVDQQKARADGSFSPCTLNRLIVHDFNRHPNATLTHSLLVLTCNFC